MMPAEQKPFLERAEVKRINDKLESLIHKESSSKLIVVFCGIFSAGKSSIINELLQQDFKLPTGTKPVTKFVTKIEYGDKFEAFCICANRKAALGREQAKKVMEGVQKPPEGCRYLSIKMPAEILRPDVVFLDTPGYGDDEDLENAVQSAVWASDVAVFCCHAGHFGRHFEQKYFRELEERIGNFCVAVNHADALYTKEAFQRVQDYVGEISAGRGAKQLGRLADATTFFTVGAGKYADLGGLDQFFMKLRDAQGTEWERLKKYACRKKISYGIKLLLPEVEQGIQAGQEALQNARQKKEKEYQEKMGQYNQECRRIESLIESGKRACLELLEGQLQAIGGELDELEREGKYAVFAEEAAIIIKGHVMTVPDFLEHWREKERLAQSYQVAHPDTRFRMELLGYSVPAPQGRKVKKQGRLKTLLMPALPELQLDLFLRNDEYDMEYHGYAAAAASHIRYNLAPKLQAAVEEYLTCVAEESMPQKPEPEDGFLKEIEWDLEDWRILKRKMMFCYEKVHPVQ